MASNKTATIIFKGDDQISPAIKGAAASVAGLKGSFDAVEAGVKQAYSAQFSDWVRIGTI